MKNYNLWYKEEKNLWLLTPNSIGAHTHIKKATLCPRPISWYFIQHSLKQGIYIIKDLILSWNILYGICPSILWKKSKSLSREFTEYFYLYNSKCLHTSRCCIKRVAYKIDMNNPIKNVYRRWLRNVNRNKYDVIYLTYPPHLVVQWEVVFKLIWSTQNKMKNLSYSRLVIIKLKLQRYIFLWKIHLYMMGVYSHKNGWNKAM